MNLTRVCQRVNDWQQLGYVHPLTCGQNSNHKPLIASVLGDDIVLLCEDCNYKQDVPDMFFDDDMDKVISQYKEIKF